MSLKNPKLSRNVPKTPATVKSKLKLKTEAKFFIIIFINIIISSSISIKLIRIPGYYYFTNILVFSDPRVKFHKVPSGPSIELIIYISRTLPICVLLFPDICNRVKCVWNCNNWCVQFSNFPKINIDNSEHKLKNEPSDPDSYSVPNDSREWFLSQGTWLLCVAL